MSESKVVIRINLGKDDIYSSESAAKTVTVWHYHRIVAVLLLLLVLGISLFKWVFTEDNTEERRQLINVTPNSGLDSKQEIVSNSLATVSKENKPSDVAAVELPRPLPDKALSSIIFSKKVIRASLNYQIKQNEPFEQVKNKVKIAPNKTMELFYFTELKSAKDKSFMHNWTKDGKQIYKKVFDVKKIKEKIISTRKLSINDKGEWTIQLVDDKGNVYSKVSFIVD